MVILTNNIQYFQSHTTRLYIHKNVITGLLVSVSQNHLSGPQYNLIIRVIARVPKRCTFRCEDIFNDGFTLLCFSILVFVACNVNTNCCKWDPIQA